MKTKLAALALLTASLIGCRINTSVLNSALTVRPGKQFELGGNQRGAFTVQARNVGPVSVALSERRADGQIVPLGTFAPRSEKTIRFAAGSAALVTNSSTEVAQLNLTVTGDKDGLSMSEQNPKNL
jgi:hypothetical protein